MQSSNLEIILLGSGLVGIVLLMAVTFLTRALNSTRKQTRTRLDKFRTRFGERTRMKGDHARSIRLNQQQTGLAGHIASLLPKRDQIQKRIAKAGLSTPLSRYATISGLLALFSALTIWLMGAPFVLSVLLGITVGAGLPHMVISNRIKSRTTRFTQQFPEAMDLMVRGLKSGLPVNECITNVAKELPAPTGVEFQKITDAMRLGKQLEEALWETADRLDTPDFKFFVISLVVQRETGGNLGETLGNLSNILRQRQAMKLKIKALSSEAKASAWIVGALPFIMLGLIMTMNYDYGIVLFTHPKAIIAGIGALLWMAIGMVIMAKMIRFEV
ncbi:type II secretion system F family protein [Kordiimonas pumila]|uniref:Type II secretion system F family protein n=1 Tax=Kordiimonas pumila TaxID=2161677 RepID=A0ABV7D734_9PROT|nr:type II secretion system F family protein [Kordiimonas pumila]